MKIHWSELTLREQVYQLMAPCGEQFHDDWDMEAWFKENPVGFYFTNGENGVNNAERIAQKEETATKACIRAYRSYSKVPLCICADGIYNFGVDHHMPGSSFGAANDEALAYQWGVAEGMMANHNELDWIFGPTVDIVRNKMCHISNTSISDDAETVARMANAIVAGMQSQGVASTAKHFPGIGSSYTNFHLAKAKNPMSREEWDSTYGMLYSSLFNGGVKAVMTSHLTLPAYQDEKDSHGRYLCTTVSSQLTTDLLKKKLGFQGVVVTDALMMGGCSTGDPVQLAVDTFKAGSDVLLFPSLKAADAIVAALEKGEIPMERLYDALNRIWALKEWLGLFDENRTRPAQDAAYVRNTADTIQEKSIALVKDEDIRFPIDREKVKKILVVGAPANEGDAPRFEKFAKALELEGFTADYRNYLGTAWQHDMNAIQDQYDLLLVVYRAGTMYTVPLLPGGRCTDTLWSMHKIYREKKYVLMFGTAHLYDVYFQDEPVYLQSCSDLWDDAIDRMVDVLLGRKEATGRLACSVDRDV